MAVVVLSLVGMIVWNDSMSTILDNSVLHCTKLLRLCSVPPYFSTRQPQRPRIARCKPLEPSQNASSSQCDFQLVWQKDRTARERPKPARTTEAPGHVRHVTAERFEIATDRLRHPDPKTRDAVAHRPKGHHKGAHLRESDR